MATFTTYSFFILGNKTDDNSLPVNQSLINDNLNEISQNILFTEDKTINYPTEIIGKDCLINFLFLIYVSVIKFLKLLVIYTSSGYYILV